MYTRLDHTKIISTLEALTRRIAERFSHSGLEKVAQELLQIGRKAPNRLAWIQRPHWELRAAVGIVMAAILFSLAFALSKLRLPSEFLSVSEFVQVLESAINDIVLIGAAVLFLITVENRVKRRRILELLHELRSMAHVVDMHQLTKDPEVLVQNYTMTASSPQRTMNRFELQRYLDYCSEVLSLIGKVAALYIQDFNDAQAVASVNEIEDLTNGLSRKIWQKIIILQSDQG